MRTDGLYRQRHSNLPPFQTWRHRYTGAVNMMLRLVHGAWPIPDLPRTALEAFHRDLVDSYDAWLRDLRGLSLETRTKRTARALQFLTSLGPRADKESLASLSVQEIDAYVRHCCAGLGRAAIEDRTVCLRSKATSGTFRSPTQRAMPSYQPPRSTISGGTEGL